jgi:hypothetical protein
MDKSDTKDKTIEDKNSNNLPLWVWVLILIVSFACLYSLYKFYRDQNTRTLTLTGDEFRNEIFNLCNQLRNKNQRF